MTDAGWATVEMAAGWWLTMLADASLKGAVLLALSAMVTGVVMRGSASARHMVWTLTLGGLVALPVLSAVLPGLQVLPEWSAPAARAIAPPARDDITILLGDESESLGAEGNGATIGATAAGAGEASPTGPRRTPGTEFAGDPRGLEWPRHGVAAAGSDTVKMPLIPAGREAIAQPHNSPLRWWTWAVGVWLAGMAVMLLPAVIGKIGLRLLTRRCRPAPTGTWPIDVMTLAGEIGIRRPVRVLMASQRTMPMVWGLRRPTVVLPADAAEWSADRLRMVLLHELAHVHRRDCLTHWLGRLARAVYWFNPLAWYGLHRMAVERERACDDMVLAAGSPPAVYAEQLLHVAASRQSRGLATTAAIAMARPSRMESRLLAILDPRRNRRGLTKLAACGAVVALLAVVVFLAALHPKTADAQTPTGTDVPGAPAKAETDARPETAVDTTSAATDIGVLHYEPLPIDQTDYYCIQEMPQPTSPPPATVPHTSDAAVYWHYPKSQFRSAFMIDNLQGQDAGYDTLYSDFNGDGDLTNDPIYTASTSAPSIGPAGGKVVAVFESVRLMQNPVQNNQSICRVVVEQSDRWGPDAPPVSLVIMPHTWAVGRVMIQDRPVPVALIDRNWNGQVTDATGLETNYHPLRYPKGDYLVIGIDGESSLTVPTGAMGQGGSARTILNPLLMLNDTLYRLSLETDDQTLRMQLTPIKRPMGGVTFSEASHSGRLNLIGTTTSVLIGKPAKTIQLPIDTYRWPDEEAVELVKTQPDHTTPVARQDAPIPTAHRSQIRNTYQGDGSITDRIAPARTVTLTVLDATTGKPLPSAKVQSRCDYNSQEFSTNDDGVCAIPIYRKDHNYFSLTVTASGHVPTGMRWDSQQGELVPDQFTLPVEPGTSIGGIIQNEQGQPIENASVYLLIPSEPYAGKPRPRLSRDPILTNSKGQWRCDVMPAAVSDIWIKLAHEDYINDPMYNSTTKPPMEKLRDMTGVMVMRKGQSLHGVVTDSQGKPIVGVKVMQGADRWGSDYPTTDTDSQGRFTFDNIQPNDIILTAQCAGYAPDLKVIQPRDFDKPVTFTLKKGNTIRGRVVDAAGEPLHEVGVAADTWRGYRSVEWRSQTDIDGWFEWRDAPDDEVLFDLYARDHMSIRNHALIASQPPQTLTMLNVITVTGHVTDAATGDPIPEFTTLPGIDWGNGNNQPIHWERSNPGQGRNGRYTIRFGEPRFKHLLRIEADGYAPAISEGFADDAGNLTLNFKLTPAENITGIVQLPDKSPAAGVPALLAIPGQGPQITNGRISHQNNIPATQTDAQGRFEFPTQDTNFTIILLSDDGYAEVTKAQLSESSTITLQPWAKIEGTLCIGATPAKNETVSASHAKPYRPNEPQFWIGYDAKTDAQGHFTLERVIPQKISVGRRIARGPRSWTTSHQVELDPQPGQTLNVRLGGYGRPVTGRITLPDDIDPSVDWSFGFFTLRRQQGAVGSIFGGLYDSLLAGKQGYPIRPKLPDSYVMVMDDDGSFRVDDVPAGTYTAGVQLHERPANRSCGWGDLIGTATHTFTVPDMPNGRLDDELNIGDIPLDVLKTVRVNDDAPLFECQTLDDQPLKLADYRGKLVLLDFWATWCGPCRGETPHLKKAWDRFKSDDRFVMIGLSLDKTAGKAKIYVDENALGWIQGFLADGWKLPKQYGVNGIPAIMLIGPDGKIIAKSLRGTAIEPAIEKALGTMPEKSTPPATAADADPLIPARAMEPSNVAVNDAEAP